MRYFLISLGVVLLIIFGVVIFNRGGSTPTRSIKKPITLLDYATNNNASVQYIVEGPINALENHRTTQVVVSPTSRIITVFSGYQQQTLGSKTLPNDQNSYKAFLNALNQANFTREKVTPRNVNPASVCPTGSRTHYQLVDGAKDVMDLWSATCTAAGSFGGNVPLTSTLFQTQIPGYSQFVGQFQPQSQ
jgi:hypothetical protein